MSTRSRIGIEHEDGTITSIYCHFDGYPEGVGQCLAGHYTDPTKINALIALGNLSCLDDEVAPPEGVPHSYGAAAKGVTVAYGRDRGETGVEADTHASREELLEAARQTHGEYTYLFANGEWLVSPYRREFKSLADVLSADNSDDEAEAA